MYQNNYFNISKKWKKKLQKYKNLSEKSKSNMKEKQTCNSKKILKKLDKSAFCLVNMIFPFKTLRKKKFKIK